MRRSPLRSLAAPLAVALLAVLLLSPASFAAKKAAIPPVLDRELFFGDPEISQAQISPDGKFITFIKPLDGTRNIWVKKTEEPFDKARPLTADKKRPIPGYFWSRDSKFVLFVQDNDGDENYNVYAVDPTADQAAGSRVPAARNLTALEKTRALIYSVPRKMPDVIFVGLNDRDASWHDLYRVEIGSGERKLLRENKERIAGWFFDNDGKLRLAERIADDGSTEILLVEESGFKPAYTCSVLETCNPVRYHKDGRRVYMVTNKGEGVDLARLVLFDPATGKEELVEADPLKRVDFGDAMFSEVTDELIGTVYEDERMRMYFRDKVFEADYELLNKKLEGKDVLPNSSTADEKIWLVTATSDVEPGQRYLFDRKSKKLTLQYSVFDKLPREHLAPMQAVHFPSSDGLEIPAFLTLPQGVEPKGLPLLVFPHGGPWSRDAWGYDALAQFFANRGYAVLQPNFRGSTGYGKKFLNAGNNEWGQKMQDDLTWGVKHFVANGVADPKRVAILGGSYGGYATLAGVAFTPEVYAAAVSIVGPSNLITLLDSIPPYWESIRTIFHHRMGDPRTPEGRKQLERQSPLNSADKIKTPLLVVQGANDPRVKKAESDQIVVALRDRKFPVEYLVAPDEGHGFSHPVNNLALFATAEKFLAKHVGGRAQADVKAEVAEKLKAITVDVATVTLPKKVDAAAVGAPKPTKTLLAGTHRYDAKIEAAGQTMNLSIEREIKEENGNWVVVDRVKGPMGDGEDRVTLDKATLTLIDRAARQGPAEIAVSYGAEKASGTMNISGQERPIAITIGGPVFADGAGGPDVVAALPLAEGYTAMYRNVDLQQQAEKVMRLVVTGIESVTVPAGTFESWRVELSPVGGDPGGATVWIARDSRAVVKVSAVLPQLNGAIMTHELTH